MNNPAPIESQAAREAARSARPSLRVIQSGANAATRSAGTAATRSVGTTAARSVGSLALRGVATVLGGVATVLGILLFPSTAHAPAPPIRREIPEPPDLSCVQGCAANRDVDLDEIIEREQLSEADTELLRRCHDIKQEYDGMKDRAATSAQRIKSLRQKIENNTATPQDITDFCFALEDYIRGLEKLHQHRNRYINLDCDKFDWRNRGNTEQERRESHLGAARQLDRQIRNLHRMREMYCR